MRENKEITKNNKYEKVISPEFYIALSRSNKGLL